MFKLTCCFITILFFSVYSYAHTQNIYITNSSSNTISVFGFRTKNDQDFLYRQSIWVKPANIGDLYLGIKVNPFTRRQAYIFADGLKLLNLDESGNISQMENLVDQPSAAGFVQSMTFGPYSEETLRSKLYLFGTDIYDRYLIQVLSSDAKGSLKSQSLNSSEDSGYPDSAVFARNIDGSTNAYVLSHVLNAFREGVSDVAVFSMSASGNLLSSKQFIQSRNKYASISVTPDEYSRFVFTVVKPLNLIEVYERDPHNGKLSFLYSKVSNGIGPIKVIPSSDGHFIFVLYAENNAISVFSVPASNKGYVTLLHTYKLADSFKDIKGKIVDGAFGARYENNYLYVLVGGNNVLLSYAVDKEGRLTFTQKVDTGGYGSGSLELRNVE